MGSDLDKLNKPQLIEKIKTLQARDKSLTDSDVLLHELQVHQLELEMQNQELRESQQLLEETRDRYADLYDFAPVFYINLNDTGIILNINLTGAAILDQVRARIIGQPLTKWILRSDVRLFFNHLQRTLNADQKVTDEIRLLNNAGNEIDARIESIRGWSAEMSAYVCQSVILDVTEENKSKKEISLKARQLRIITDALPVLVAYINDKGEYQFVNRSYSDWFGISAKEIKGKKIAEVWEQDTYQKLYRKYRIALAGRLLSFDMQLDFPGAKKRYINATFIPDADFDGQVYGVIIMIGDITDRLLIEAIDRKRLLESAHYSRLSAMGEMASEIAHELNQPLAAISIYSDACRRLLKSDKAEPDKIMQALGDINEQATRAGNVIRRVREFASKKELLIVSTSINDIVQEAMSLIAVELRSHNVKLVLKLADDLPLLSIDRILIEQVMLNLSRNAIEAMDEIAESERLLHISTVGVKPAEIEVCIEDQGPGMTIEQIKNIFEPFHTTKAEGMGMGLTISQSIIKSHHGRLWAIQNDCGGTTFCFTLPLDHEELRNGR
ncbi:MAG: ATP-binding protein [Gammaproteobacteria bacterium]|nr:ATP-binding protein [Gammaproteobacteria bacterium]